MSLSGSNLNLGLVLLLLFQGDYVSVFLNFNMLPFGFNVSCFLMNKTFLKQKWSRRRLNPPNMTGVVIKNTEPRGILRHCDLYFEQKHPNTHTNKNPYNPRACWAHPQLVFGLLHSFLLWAAVWVSPSSSSSVWHSFLLYAFSLLISLNVFIAWLISIALQWGNTWLCFPCCSTVPCSLGIRSVFVWWPTDVCSLGLMDE